MLFLFVVVGLIDINLIWGVMHLVLGLEVFHIQEVFRGKEFQLLPMLTLPVGQIGIGFSITNVELFI
jgi:hypothetical protein